jgi:hypothetical protein
LSFRDREAESREVYRRLPGRSWGLLGRTTLWQGSDHILQVQSRGYSEAYRRFYFREIQALVLRPTTRSRNISLVLLTLALLAFGAAMLGTPPGTIFWLVLGTPFALALLAQAPGGPSCIVHVRTAIETSQLTALCRRRTAERSLAAIAELVEGVQGTATPAETALFADTAEALATPASTPVSTFAPALAPTPPPTPASSRPAAPANVLAVPPPALPGARSLRWHWALFALLLVDAVLSAGQVWAPGRLLDAAALVLGLAQATLAITAIVAGRSLQIEPQLRRATNAALVYVCAVFVLGWVSSMVSSFEAAASGTFRPGLIPDPTLAPWVAGATIPACLGLGVWGLYLLRRARPTT